METPNVLGGNGPLIWSQPEALMRKFELKRDEVPVGRLEFETMCGSRASAEVGSQSWTFKREGFLSPRVTVRAPNSEENLAVFQPRWSGAGILEFASGRRVEWRQTSFWGGVWAFLAEDGRTLIRFGLRNGLLKTSAVVEIDPADAGAPEVFLLAALGWYLMVLTAEDAVAVSSLVATVC